MRRVTSVGKSPFESRRGKMEIPSLPNAPDDIDELLQTFEPLPADALTSDDIFDANSSTEIIAVEPITYTSSPISKESTSPTSRELLADRRARHRARARNEHQSLREFARELELRLQQWKDRASSGGQSLSPAPSTQSKVWKALAVRQKLERHKSEVENLRLRELLDNQLRFAMQLQHLIAMREIGTTGVPSTLPLPRVSIDEADVALLEMYLSELDAVYAQTDQILRETSADLRPETPHRVIRTRTVASGNILELVDTHVMESNLETTRKNSWAVIMHLYLRRSGMLYTPPGGSHPNTVLMKFSFPCKWLGRDSSVTITHSLKIFDEPDRQVNVYRVLHVGEGGLAGMATDETGWSILTPSATNPNRTVCRSIAREVPMRFHRPASLAGEHSPPELVKFVKILFEVGDADFGVMLSQLPRLSISCPGHEDVC